jgi:hypothetical protein
VDMSQNFARENMQAMDGPGKAAMAQAVFQSISQFSRTGAADGVPGLLPAAAANGNLPSLELSFGAGPPPLAITQHGQDPPGNAGGPTLDQQIAFLESQVAKPPPGCVGLGARLDQLASVVGGVAFAETDDLAQKIQLIRAAI